MLNILASYSQVDCLLGHQKEEIFQKSRKSAFFSVCTDVVTRERLGSTSVWQGNGIFLFKLIKVQLPFSACCICEKDSYHLD